MGRAGLRGKGKLWDPDADKGCWRFADLRFRVEGLMDVGSAGVRRPSAAHGRLTTSLRETMRYTQGAR